MKYLETLTQDFGRWQFFLLCIAGTAIMNLAPSHVAVPFYAPKQKHWCSFPDNFTSQDGLNLTDSINDDSCEFPIVKDKNGLTLLVQKNKSKEQDIYKCTSWIYDSTDWKKTIVEDFGLVCDRDVLISTSSFVYMAGVMVGVSSFGMLADKYGRRFMANICNALWLITSLITAFSFNYVMFAVMRFFVAACAIGTMTICYVWCMESCSSKGRSIAGTTLGIMWCGGMLAITAFSYFTRDWFWTQILSAALIGTYYLFVWGTLESPSWQFSVGRFDAGMESLKKAAKMNGKLEPDESLIRQELEDTKAPGQESASFLDLFRYPNLRKKTLILYYNWFVVSFIYFALTLNTGDLGGDLFVNMTIASVLEGIGYATAIVLLVKIGRRLPTAICFIISGICCFLVAFIPDGSDTLNWIKVGIALVGRTTISISFNNLLIYTSEIHPTVVRTIGLGSSSMVARVSGMLAPYVKELGKFTNASVPMILFGILATTSGALGLLLPETKGRALPHTIEEGEAFGKKPSNNQRRTFSFLKSKQKSKKELSLQNVAVE